MSKQLKLAILLTVFLVLHASMAGAVTDEQEAPDLESYRGQNIAAIEYTGYKITKLYIIEREVRSEVGTPLKPALVEADLIRLQNLPIFGSVTLKATQGAGGVVLEYELNELPRIIPYPALRYTEENGFAIGAGVVSPNLRGRSQSLSLRALFGGMNIFGISFSDPWITGNHVSGGIRFTHNIRQNQLLDYEQTEDYGGLLGGTYLGERGRLNGFLGYVGVASDTDGITLDPDNRDEIISAIALWGHDSRNSWLTPRSGWQNQWLLLSYFGGDANFWSFQVDLNRYQPIRDNHSMVFGPLFTYQTGEVGVDIPPYLQFFLGGANTIRGYKLLELGKELYGKNQLLYNWEYRWNFYPMRTFKIISWKLKCGFQLAGFADAGIAWSRPQDLSLNRTRFGFGGGLRLLLPVFEMIRFDVGVSQYGDVKFNFGIQSIYFMRRLRVR